MLVRRLVIGVRSSCEASATSWRWAATERSSVSSIALKCSASSPISSWVCDLDPASEVLGGGDVARGLGDVRDRRDDVARDEPPERDRERDAAEADEQEDQPQPREHRVGRLQRAAELDREAVPSSGAVSTRTCVPSTSASAKNPARPRRRRRAPGRRPAARTRSEPRTASTFPLASTIWMYGVGPPRRAGSGPKPGPPRRAARRARGATSSCSSQRAVDLGAQLPAHGEIRRRRRRAPPPRPPRSRPRSSSGGAAAASASVHCRT